MTIHPDADPAGHTPFEIPFSFEGQPETLAFYQGIVTGLAYVGLRGAKVVVGGEHLRAMSENRLKQLAVNASWQGIDILKKQKDPDLDEKARALLGLTEQMPYQATTREQNFSDLNS